jgi:hypothetical protein
VALVSVTQEAQRASSGLSKQREIMQTDWHQGMTGRLTGPMGRPLFEANLTCMQTLKPHLQDCTYTVLQTSWISGRVVDLAGSVVGAARHVGQEED